MFVFTLQKHNLLYVGESINIDASNIKKITVTNSKVIKVEKLENSRVIISAKRKGSSSIHVTYKDKDELDTFHFNIMSSEVYRRYRAVNTTLSQLKDVEVKVAGEYIYILGYVDNKNDLDIVSKVASTDKKNINLVKISNESLNIRENEIYSNLLKLKLTDIDFKNIDSICFIKGICKNNSEKDRIETYLKAVLPNCNLEIKLIPYQVDINIKIIEASKSILDEFGLQMPSTYELTRKTVLSNIEMDSILHINSMNGSIKTIASPALTSNSGQMAKFHAGGEFPIKLSSRYNNSIIWKQYGVILNFTPNVINENTLSIKIESEFSDVDDSKSVDSLPGISKKNINTIITVETGKSLLISGLIKKTNSKFISGYPIINKIPLISSIFSYERTNSESTELAMIITPNIRYWGEEKELLRKLDELFEEFYKI